MNQQTLPREALNKWHGLPVVMSSGWRIQQADPERSFCRELLNSWTASVITGCQCIDYQVYVNKSSTVMCMGLSYSNWVSG